MTIGKKESKRSIYPTNWFLVVKIQPIKQCKEFTNVKQDDLENKMYKIKKSYINGFRYISKQVAYWS